jgi:hypothetical protein
VLEAKDVYARTLRQRKGKGKGKMAPDANCRYRRRSRREEVSPITFVNEQTVSLTQLAKLYISRKRRINSNNLSTVALETLEILGVEGMSSADSEGEMESDQPYYVKLHPWRAPALTAWLHEIDTLPISSNNSYSSRVYKKRPRVLGQQISEVRDPPKGLPVSFYNQEWLLSRSEWAKESLDICQTSYVLPGVFTSKSYNSYRLSFSLLTEFF